MKTAKTSKQTIQELSQSPYPILSVKGESTLTSGQNPPNSPLISGTGRKAFTLVELIIVITILAILATIAFMSFQGYAKQSRDSNRLTTIKTIEKGVDLFLTKSGKIPAPDEATAFTGGSADNPVKISQGTVGAQMVQIINMNQVPLDPKTQAKYHYSVFGETPYYQIGIEQEQDGVSYISPTFADSEEVMISGNYTFDPSLPSLFVVKDSVVSGGLFGTGVCFVVDGGENTFETENEGCETKTQLLEKGFDTSLVGYWDMESTTGGKLKDLSGNGNHGTFTGSILPTMTGGYLGGGVFFTGSNYTPVYSFIEVPHNNSLNVKEHTIQVILKINGTFQSNIILSKGTMDTWPSCVFSGTLVCENYMIAYHPGSKMFHGASNNSGIRNTTKTTLKSIQNGKYSMLTVKYIKINNLYIYDIFLNGVKQNTTSSLEGTEPPLFNTKSLTFGGRPYTVGTPSSFSQGFNGVIDDIKIYNRALSDQEIAQQARIAGF